MKILRPLPALFAENEIRIVCLVKPQFELEREQIGAGGIVSDEALRLEAVEKIINFSRALGLSSQGVVASSIKGSKGNQEYLLYLRGG